MAAVFCRMLCTTIRGWVHVMCHSESTNILPVWFHSCFFTCLFVSLLFHTCSFPYSPAHLLSGAVLCQKTQWVYYCVMKWDIGLRGDVHNSVVKGALAQERGMRGYSCGWIASLRKLNLLFLWAVPWSIKCEHWWTSDSSHCSPCGQFTSATLEKQSDDMKSSHLKYLCFYMI